MDVRMNEEMERYREGKDVWLMKTGNGHGVANGLDIGRVEAVVDVVTMPAPDVLAFEVLLLLKVMPR